MTRTLSFPATPRVADAGGGADLGLGVPITSVRALGAAPAAQPTIGISGPASVTEGNSGSTSVTYTLARSGDLSGASSVLVTIGGTGSNPVAATDFVGDVFPSGTVSFAAGESSKTFGAAVKGDAAIEPDESMLASLSNAVGATISVASAATTVTNDDAAAANIPALILDSDTEVDNDDLAAIGVVIGMQRTGEISIAAMLATNCVPKGAPMLRGILNYSGLNAVPVGAYRGDGLGTGSSWAGPVAAMLGQGDQDRMDFPDAVAVARQALVNMTGSNNLYITLGSPRVLSLLMASPADAISSLTGLQLMQAKLARVVSMAGGYPNNGTYDYNYGTDAAAGQYVFTNMPAGMFKLSSGMDSSSISVGPAATQDPALDPYRYGFTQSDQPMDANGKRLAYDPTAVIRGVRGANADFGEVYGTASMTQQGISFAVSSSGPHANYTFKVAASTIATKMDALIAQAYIAPYAVAAPTNITFSNVGSTTAKANFAEPTGSTYLQYRVNGGAWQNLIYKTRLVAGLTAGQANQVEFRGGRPGMAGATSAAVTVTTQAAQAPWTPASLAANQKVAHYRFEADALTQTAGAVSAVTDQFGLRNLAQATAALQPTFGATAFNGEAPGVDASSDELVSAAVSGLTDSFFCFMLMRYKGGNSNDGRLVSLARGGSADWDLGVVPMAIRSNGTWWASFMGKGSGDGSAVAQTPLIVSSFISGTTATKRVNGAVLNTATVAAVDMSAITRMALFDNVHDAGTQEPCQAQLAEVVLAKNLSQTEIEKIEGYLAWRARGTGNVNYVGLLAAAHPYKAAAPV